MVFLLRWRFSVMLVSVLDTSVGRWSFSSGCFALRASSSFFASSAAYLAASLRIRSSLSKSSSSSTLFEDASPRDDRRGGFSLANHPPLPPIGPRPGLNPGGGCHPGGGWLKKSWRSA